MTSWVVTAITTTTISGSSIEYNAEFDPPITRSARTIVIHLKIISAGLLFAGKKHIELVIQ